MLVYSGQKVDWISVSICLYRAENKVSRCRLRNVIYGSVSSTLRSALPTLCSRGSKRGHKKVKWFIAFHRHERYIEEHLNKMNNTFWTYKTQAMKARRTDEILPTNPSADAEEKFKVIGICELRMIGMGERDVFSDEQFGQLHKRLLAAMQAASVKCANADIEVIKTDIKNIADMMDENVPDSSLISTNEMVILNNGFRRLDKGFLKGFHKFDKTLGNVASQVLIVFSCPLNFRGPITQRQPKYIFDSNSTLRI
ncbi:hypothetical protein PLEOSDRAFT_166836 [Pleurotus ostreatus PC15]|uniref:Uncharacterized protein n=1 Tax=Pleurotus ostreatus (strain PC15) TaxID=1137138 RepID=A0A067NKQ5_PLEO1|nr:hypothetical protein PLEOSDRAFT_166836 [Pleurotus ostreatus PC15]